MKGYVLLFLLMFLIGCKTQVDPGPNPEAALEGLIAAERAFAQTSVNGGMRSAFLAFLADDGIIFRPTPTNGKEWFADRPESSATLFWQPAYADVASTGDLGYTTGPYSVTDSTGTPRGYGHYVTVWRVQADSTWRVEIDFGISHARPDVLIPDQVASPQTLSTVEGLRKLYQEAARVNLLKTDRDMAEVSADQGTDEAFREVLSDSVRVYRNGAFPTIGESAFAEVLSRQTGVSTWVPINAEVSQAGDLGYTYGLATVRASADDSTAASSAYLRIWKRPAEGTWTLVLDLASPIPDQEE